MEFHPIKTESDYQNVLKERESSSWGEEVMNWQGCPEFELPTRDDLLPPKEEIF